MDREFYATLAKDQAKHWWYRGRRANLEAVLSKYLRGKSNCSILEIGAGSGGNIEMLQKFGSIDAVEMQDESREIIESNFPSVTVRNGALPDAEVFANKSYDVIAMFDVLEHVEAERESLTAITSHIADDGLLIISVPAYKWLWSHHDEVAHHFRRYTKGRLQTALVDTGWDVQQVGYFNTLLFPLAVAARMKDKVSKSEALTGLRPPVAPVNGLFYNIFSSERPIVRNGGFPFGLSVLAVAKLKEPQ